MDIAGAKALKERIGPNEAHEVSSTVAGSAEDAPPVFHWFGVSHRKPEAPAADAHDEPGTRTASLFRRLGLSFR
jgi:hypothetical protein